MEKLSKDDEKRILGSLETAISAVNSGADPNEALAKAAMEQGFGPTIVSRMVEAFNVSKTLHHFKQASPDKRADSFPLADTKTVLGKIYTEPAKQAAAVSFVETNDYMRRPVCTELWAEKKAAPLPLDPDLVYGRWVAERDRLSNETESARLEVFEAGRKLAAAVEKAAEYFRSLGTKEAFAEVERRAVWEYGTLGTRCMDLIYKAGGLREKRAEAAPVSPLVFDRSRAPYTLIANVVSWAKAAQTKAAASVQVMQRQKKHKGECPLSGRKKACLLDKVLSGEDEDEAKSASEHAAEIKLLLGTDKQAVLTLPMTDIFSALTKPVEPGVYFDPQQEATLKTVRVKTMLNDLMSNDEVISQYPRDQVVEAYNKLTEIAPEASSKSIIMRGLLRRALQQGEALDPHEAAQVADLERAIPSPLV